MRVEILPALRVAPLLCALLMSENSLFDTSSIVRSAEACLPSRLTLRFTTGWMGAQARVWGLVALFGRLWREGGKEGGGPGGA